jgi:hypothetical protein
MWSQPPCSFVTCPSHRTSRPIGPTMKSEDSSRSLPCSRPRVLPRGDTGLPRSSLRSPPDRKERPQFIPSTPNGTRRPLSVNASSTTENLEKLVTTSSSAGGANTVKVQLEPNWRIPYLDHLTRGGLLSDKIEARRIARRAKSFVIFGDSRELYRRSPTSVLQCCITNEEGRNLLNDLHSGACGHHTAPRTLVGNTFRQDFYWSTMVSDVVKLVRSCKGYQCCTSSLSSSAKKGSALGLDVSLNSRVDRP